jgi:hypothetical protein
MRYELPGDVPPKWTGPATILPVVTMAPPPIKLKLKLTGLNLS